jgi:hypothetical protein
VGVDVGGVSDGGRDEVVKVILGVGVGTLVGWGMVVGTSPTGSTNPLRYAMAASTRQERRQLTAGTWYRIAKSSAKAIRMNIHLNTRMYKIVSSVQNTYPFLINH